MTSRHEQRRQPDLPLRVSTLELFFDLVFVFTLTQLSSLLTERMSLAAAAQVLLIFGVLWWMYGGYAWLTNTRTPSRAPERLLLLLGMAGFLIVGLAIPHAFGDGRGHGRDGLALGIGYLLVIAVHGVLYLRINQNFARVFPFNLVSALLVLSAGFVSVGYEYVLWTAALAVQALSPLIIHPRGRFSIQPAHFVERHGALMIVAFGESVAGVGIGAAGQPVTVSLALSAALGLALAAALWWAFFGTGDDARAEAAMTSADPVLRPQLALSAYFYAYIPMLLGIVAVAAGLKHAIGHPEMTLTTGSAFALSAGVTLFMAGDGIFRHVLRIGSPWFRAGASAVALAAWPVAAAVGAAAGIVLLTVVVAATLAAERRAARVTVNA